MNKFIDSIWEVIISIVATLLFALLCFVWDELSWKVIVAYLIPACIIIFITLIILRRYTKIGLMNWRTSTTSGINLEKEIKKASNCVDVFFAGSVIDYALSKDCQNEIIAAARRGVRFRFLVGKVSLYETQKAETEQSSAEQILRILTNIKDKALEPHFRKNIRIGVCEKSSVWSWYSFDQKRAFLDYYVYPKDNHVEVNIKKVKEKQTYFDAFSNEFDIFWRASRQIHCCEDLDRLVSEQLKRKEKGILVAITGPSGAGKTTITKAVKEKFGKKVGGIKTYTTRPQRNPNELLQYKFVNKKEFQQMQARGELLVSSLFCDNYYGVSTHDVNAIINNKLDLILDTIASPIDFKQVLGDRALLIYVTGPTNEVMQERILNRGESLSENDFSLRCKDMYEKAQMAKYCDYIVVNEDVNETVELVCKIIECAKGQYLETGSLICDEVYDNTTQEMIERGVLPYDSL